jgi:hypothetical protein
LTAPASPAFGCLTEDHLNLYALIFYSMRHIITEFFQQFPGDFGAMGQDSIVGQSFILLNAQTHFFGLAARSVCGTNVHLANLEKAIY